jgi:alpha-galactosidase
MSNALNSTDRQFLYSLCNWGDDKPWEWASTISNSARMSGDITDSYSKVSTSCPCGPDEYYCELPGYGCSVMNILGKASHIISKNQPGYHNDLDMLEVGNGGMSYDEYKTHFSMWAAIKSPLIMGNKLDRLSPEDYGILTNPAVLAISQDPQGSAVQRQRVIKLPESEQDEWGFGEVQIWSGK